MYLRHCVYHNTFLHLLPSMYDLSEFIKKTHSALWLHVYISHVDTMHVNEFATLLRAYDKK